VGENLPTIADVLFGRPSRRIAIATTGLAFLAVSVASAADIETAIAEERQGNDKSAQSQERINSVDDQTDEMASEYRSLIDQIESLRVYNAQLSKLIVSQEAELASLDEQIANVTVIGREVTPLMLRMVDGLDQFIQLDVPMLSKERSERLAGLRELMDRADVEDSEKYRRIMEAYQIENEYGRTIEVYQDTLTMDGQERTLDLLRIGRISLLYQTLDGEEVGAWDQAEGKWVELGSEYRDSIRKGVRIARKQLAPDMVRVPVSTPEDAQ
jgi:septal ring factor EnvC (AmiA/AmiB activator)